MEKDRVSPGQVSIVISPERPDPDWPEKIPGWPKKNRLAKKNLVGQKIPGWPENITGWPIKIRGWLENIPGWPV